MDDFCRLDSGESLIEPLKREAQRFMIDTELVEQCCMQVTNRNGLIDYVIAKIICFAVTHASFDTPACQPTRKTARMVISTVVIASEFPLPIDGATKLSSEDNQCVIQEST